MNTARQLALLADPLDERFLDFHHAHPEVYERLAHLARRWREAGHDKIGIATLFEVMRWERGLRGVKDSASTTPTAPATPACSWPTKKTYWASSKREPFPKIVRTTDERHRFALPRCCTLTCEGHRPNRNLHPS